MGRASRSSGAAASFTRAELIAAYQAAIDEDFSLETLRDQLAFAAAYPDEAFSRYGAGQELIAEVKAWALNWSTEIGLDVAESKSWSEDENDLSRLSHHVDWDQGTGTDTFLRHYALALSQPSCRSGQTSS